MIGWYHWLNGHEFEQTQEIVKDREAWRAAVHGDANCMDTTQNGIKTTTSNETVEDSQVFVILNLQDFSSQNQDFSFTLLLLRVSIVQFNSVTQLCLTATP